jgi:hypothetical protein
MGKAANLSARGECHVHLLTLSGMAYLKEAVYVFCHNNSRSGPLVENQHPTSDQLILLVAKLRKPIVTIAPVSLRVPYGILLPNIAFVSGTHNVEGLKVMRNRV